MTFFYECRIERGGGAFLTAGDMCALVRIYAQSRNWVSEHVIRELEVRHHDVTFELAMPPTEIAQHLANELPDTWFSVEYACAPLHHCGGFLHTPAWEGDDLEPAHPKSMKSWECDTYEGMRGY